MGLPQRPHRIVAALLDGDVEVALGFGQAGARLGADRAAAGVDEVARRVDGRPGGEQRLLQ
jgi:hypothetical protein